VVAIFHETKASKHDETNGKKGRKKDRRPETKTVRSVLFCFASLIISMAGLSSCRPGLRVDMDYFGGFGVVLWSKNEDAIEL
jgi:hypothetical protein